MLHFGYSDQPFGCFADVLPASRKSLPDYRKADPDIFKKVGGGEGLDRALRNVAKLRSVMSATDSDNPGTDMDVLVAALRGMVPRA